MWQASFQIDYSNSGICRSWYRICNHFDVQPKRGRHGNDLSQSEENTPEMRNITSFSDGEDSEGEDLMENMQKYRLLLFLFKLQ